MFDNYTSAGKLYKKVVAAFVVITVIATAIFYAYLTKQNANKSKATGGEFASISFNPTTTTMEVGKEYTTTIQFNQSSHQLAVQGYDLETTFDKARIIITHISYKLGQVSAGLGDIDEPPQGATTIPEINASGKISFIGEVPSGTPVVLTQGRDIATITYKVNDQGAGAGLPNFQTTVNVQGKFVELKADNSLAFIDVNPNSFTAQTSNFTPSPSPAACGQFQDVDANSPFYSYIQCLGCNHVASGYQCGAAPAGQCVPPDNLPYYLPNSSITRGQAMKLVVMSAHFSDKIPPDRMTFADVPPTNTFWVYVETAYAHQLIGGYNCGGTGEPCDAQNRPYFRPGANLTRGQGVKVITLAAGYNDTIPPGTQTFTDVAPGSTFYDYVEKAAKHGLISGYTCGGTGEPCDTQKRPYFRPNADLTRGQAAKVIAVGLNCQLPNPSNPPGGGGNTTIKMKLRFQGITKQPLNDQSMKVQVKVISGRTGQATSQPVTFTSDPQGIWNGDISFNLDPKLNPAGTLYSLYIKGPKHLKKRVCEVNPKENAPGTYACAADGIQLQIGTNTVDMSNIYQLVGDLPVDEGQQNGVVDAEDTTYLRLHFGDTSAEALAVGDLNLDGVIDTQDFSLVLASLGVKYDDPEETVGSGNSDASGSGSGSSSTGTPASGGTSDATNPNTGTSDTPTPTTGSASNQ